LKTPKNSLKNSKKMIKTLLKMPSKKHKNGSIKTKVPIKNNSMN